jgi:hypothetical protein
MSAETRRCIAERYRHFAQVEARGRSRLYVEFADAVARSDAVLELLASMPASKRQPNLLFGVVRYLYGTPATGENFIHVVMRHAEEIAAVMAVRSTQTNEPARCATLLPVLARLPQPLALLEVGAAAGLCLLPDYYGYDYGTVRIGPSAPSPIAAPVFSCRAGRTTPLPRQNVEVAWRAGLDLQPVDLNDESDVKWLEALVWPGEEYRLPRLRAACEIARGNPPTVIRGDLRTDVVDLARQAPADATLVIFHTAVLAYVPDQRERAAFARSVREIGAVWVANEGPRLIPSLPGSVLTEGPDPDAFLLCVNGSPTAWTDGHGTWINWRPLPR